MTKRIFTLLLVGIASSLSAETLTSPVFSIDLATDWKHRIEQRPPAPDERGDLINIHRPDGVGELKIQSYIAPDDFSKARLRLLTNVEASTRLTWHEGKGFSGYQHSYTENGSFYKQWWLKNERTILFIVYDCDVDAQQIEIEAIDKMVNSIKINRT